MCERCGLKPQAYHGRRWCYDCKPGSKGRPRPCRRCSSIGNYWAEGLCRRCHQFAPQLPDSCRDCLAWGVYRIHKWLCQACMYWRTRYPDIKPCISCRTPLTVNEHGACRLCWRQAKLLQPRLPRRRRGQLDIPGANRYGQQLFLADMASPKKSYRPRPRPPQPPRTPYQRPSRVRPTDLFTPDPLIDAVRRHGFGDPHDLRLAATLDTAAQHHAHRHGWPADMTHRVRTALRVLLAMDTTITTPIPASRLTPLTTLGLPVGHLLAVLTTADLLTDDRDHPVDRYFIREVRDLPQAMATELRIWFDVLRNGSTTTPRSRPRTPDTIKSRIRWALPTLRGWTADGHQSLREITREHVLAVLPTDGTPRATLGAALRSIFTTLHHHKVTFTNPMASVHVGNFTRRTPLPSDHNQMRTALNNPDPPGAALAGLVIFHGLRPQELRTTQLTDLHDRRLHLPDRTLPLAEPVITRLANYLDYRTTQWPRTINPHLFIHMATAGTTNPVGRCWVNNHLGMPASALRQDRILHEVHATAGDLRRICDFFGVTMATAEHYASVLNHPALTDAPPASSNPGSPTPAPI